MTDCPTGILVDLSDDSRSEPVKTDQGISSSVARNLKFNCNNKSAQINISDDFLSVSLLEDEKLDMFTDIFTDEEYDVGKQKCGVFNNFEDPLTVKQMVEIFTEAAKLSSILKSQSLKDGNAKEMKEEIEIVVTGDCNLSAKEHSLSERSILLPDEISLLRDSCLSDESKDEIRRDLMNHSPVWSVWSTSSDSIDSSQNLKLDQNLLSVQDGDVARNSLTSVVGCEAKGGSNGGGEVAESGKSLTVFAKPSVAIKTSNNALKSIKRPTTAKETTPETNIKRTSFLTPLKIIPVKYSNQTPKSGSASTPIAVISRRRSTGTPVPTPSRPITPPVINPKLPQTPRSTLRALNTPSRVPKKNSYEIKAPKWDVSTTKKQKENCK